MIQMYGCRSAHRISQMGSPTHKTPMKYQGPSSQMPMHVPMMPPMTFAMRGSLACRKF
jgi:hypothetical protein